MSFFLLHWRAIGLVALIGTLVFFIHLAGVRGNERDVARAEKVAAEQSRDAFKASLDEQIELAKETAAARAIEFKAITQIRDAAQAAKEGISNAPGANDPFRYSDAAYGLMREQAAGGQPAEAATSVDGR